MRLQRLIFILIDFRHFLSHILKDLQLALTGRRIVKSATQILIVIRQIQIHRPSKRPESLLLGAANPILIRKKPQFIKHINHTDEINLLSPNRRKINRRTSPFSSPFSETDTEEDEGDTEEPEGDTEEPEGDTEEPEGDTEEPEDDTEKPEDDTEKDPDEHPEKDPEKSVFPAARQAASLTPSFLHSNFLNSL